MAAAGGTRPARVLMTPPRGKSGAMSRPIWKGAISFGPVNIPVSLYRPASHPKRFSFRHLHGKDSAGFFGTNDEEMSVVGDRYASVTQAVRSALASRS